MNIKEFTERLDGEIMKLDTVRSEFCIHTEKDFTLARKFSFVSVVKSVLSFEGENLTNELLKINKFSIDTSTSSVFVQQRGKISQKPFSHCFLRLI